MRRIGVGILGLIGGILLGLVAQDLLAPALPGAALASILPLCAVAGVAVAILIYNRRSKRTENPGD